MVTKPAQSSNQPSSTLNSNTINEGEANSSKKATRFAKNSLLLRKILSIESVLPHSLHQLALAANNHHHNHQNSSSATHHKSTLKRPINLKSLPNSSNTRGKLVCQLLPDVKKYSTSDLTSNERIVTRASSSGLTKVSATTKTTKTTVKKFDSIEGELNTVVKTNADETLVVTVPRAKSTETLSTTNEYTTTNKTSDDSIVAEDVDLLDDQMLRTILVCDLFFSKI